MQYELSGVQKGIAAAVLTLASIRTNKSTTEITESMLKLVAKRKMEELEDRTLRDEHVHRCVVKVLRGDECLPRCQVSEKQTHVDKLKLTNTKPSKLNRLHNTRTLSASSPVELQTSNK